MAGGAAAEEEPMVPTLRVHQATREQVLRGLDSQEAKGFRGVDLSFLRCDIDSELADSIVGFCDALPGGSALRIAHSDLGSGTYCEQRMFELKHERKVREAEKAHSEQKKRDSSKEKDFAVSAGMRRKAEAGIKEATERLEAIDEEYARLNLQKEETPWFALFKRFEAPERTNTLQSLDLSDCGLHATGLEHLTNAILETEQHPEDTHITSLVLDGNDLGDNGMGPLSQLLRLTASIEVLQLRNVGITDQGVSKVISGLVGNKTLRLLDLRNNGLTSPDITRAAVSGVMRFNKRVEVLL